MILFSRRVPRLPGPSWKNPQHKKHEPQQKTPPILSMKILVVFFGGILKT